MFAIASPGEKNSSASNLRARVFSASSVPNPPPGFPSVLPNAARNPLLASFVEAALRRHLYPFREAAYQVFTNTKIADFNRLNYTDVRIAFCNFLTEPVPEPMPLLP